MGIEYGASIVEADPRKWERCKKAVTLQMVAEGWKTYANKFSHVRNRRARRMMNT